MPERRLRLDVSGTWELRGWRQNDWELGLTPERAKVQNPDAGPAPATVPGSVRGALTAAGLAVAPWHGEQSRLSEWIEHRHWTYSRPLPAEASVWLDEHPDDLVELVCPGLDHAGTVLVDEAVVGTFEGSFTPHRFDLTDAVRAGGSTLSIVFTTVPDGLGQNGWSSRIRDWKPRFYYGWDWTPRIVQTAITAPPVLELGPVGASLDGLRVSAGYDTDARVGRVHLERDGGDGIDPELWLDVTVSAVETVPVEGESTPASAAATARLGSAGGVLEVPDPALWQVRPKNGQGLYEVLVRLLAADGTVLDELRRRVGFRELRWEATSAAPAAADHWLCVVNGSPVFLAGVNWVPIRPDFADVGDEEYRTRLTAYRDLGFTLIRVWGGAGAEREVFYELCDELGLLVWQELPLSSSGLDNEPPADDVFAAELAAIATSYAERLSHHPSLALWGGGNELTRVTAPAVPGAPLDFGHPALAAARDALEAADPGRRSVATSPTGPRFEADAREFGLGLHHDVHGPWEFSGDDAEWRAYWNGDDAVLRSEVGVAGASPLDLLAAMDLLDAPDRAALRQRWTHSSGWWLTRFDSADPAQQVEEWVAESAERQARLLGYAARTTLERFPSCAGFVVWLGHDSFPCAVSLALLDWWGRPKPAALALGALFAEHPACTSERL
ncbi:hypothetical protein [Herbiconiux sp. A18JL235]|uniref:beta-mannosidase n=1 Tax=Herbiconiux sp. A18JL235 TaxID=3152363 RepID=A0AB39BI64_9MICO